MKTNTPAQPYLRPPILLAFLSFFLAFSWMLVPAQQDNSNANFSTFQNTPVNSVLDVYEQLSGLHLIRDSSLNSAPPVSINASGLDKVGTLRMIESALLLNGIAIVPLDDKTAKVVAAGQSRNPRSEGVHLYANAADLPPQDQVVSYYMALNYITPEEAKSIFDQQAPVHSYGSYVPAPSAQAIILTEDTSVLRQLIALKELVDVPPAQVKTAFIQLHRADAEKVADILNNLIAVKQQPMLGGGLGGLGGRAAMAQSSLITGTAVIVPDPRSNRLLIATRPANLGLLQQLALELDQPDDFNAPESRNLKYVLAGDIMPALEAALAQGKDEITEIKPPTSATTTNNGTTVNNNAGTVNSGSSNGATIQAITSAPAGAARQQRAHRRHHRQDAPHGRQPFQCHHRLRPTRRRHPRVQPHRPARPEAACRFISPPSSANSPSRKDTSSGLISSRSSSPSATTASPPAISTPRPPPVPPRFRNQASLSAPRVSRSSPA